MERIKLDAACRIAQLVNTLNSPSAILHDKVDAVDALSREMNQTFPGPESRFNFPVFNYCRPVSGLEDIASRSKIQVIKAIRTWSGFGLVEAKQISEASLVMRFDSDLHRDLFNNHIAQFGYKMS